MVFQKILERMNKKLQKKVFSILAKEGGAKLVGSSMVLQEGTFWKFSPKLIW